MHLGLNSVTQLRKIHLLILHLSITVTLSSTLKNIQFQLYPYIFTYSLGVKLVVKHKERDKISLQSTKTGISLISSATLYIFILVLINVVNTYLATVKIVTHRKSGFDRKMKAPQSLWPRNETRKSVYKSSVGSKQTYGNSMYGNTGTGK